MFILCFKINLKSSPKLMTMVCIVCLFLFMILGEYIDISETKRVELVLYISVHIGQDDSVVLGPRQCRAQNFL